MTQVIQQDLPLLLIERGERVRWVGLWAQDPGRFESIRNLIHPAEPLNRFHQDRGFLNNFSSHHERLAKTLIPVIGTWCHRHIVTPAILAHGLFRRNWCHLAIRPYGQEARQPDDDEN